MSENLNQSETFESRPESDESPQKLRAKESKSKEDNKGNSPNESLVDSISMDENQFLTSMQESKK